MPMSVRGAMRAHVTSVQTMLEPLHVLLVVLALSGCSPSTSAPPPFDTGLDPSRAATSLSATEIRDACDRLADATQMDFDRIGNIVCLSGAAFADTQEHCTTSYDQCMARLGAEVTFSCDPAGRLTPSENPSVCAGVTVDQIEHGLTVYLGATTTMTPATLCAMPHDERVGFGNLDNFGATESDLAGFDCAVNTTLHPALLCDGAPCISL
jgi:hypothetical protein